MAPRSASSAAAADSSSAAPSSSSSSSSAAAPSATRLDPSLFQSYFTQAPKSILKSSPADTRTPSEIAEERRRARAAARRARERKGGVVQGRDGRPMKRLKDGRTVVRALQDGGGEGEGEEVGEEGETERLARRRGDRFVGQKLGLRGGDGDDKPKKAASSGSSSSKSARNDDDPLGLGDPAFLPGGQFAHLANLTGKANRKKRTRSSSSKKVVSKSQQRGAATRSALPFSSARPAMAFARASK